MATPTNMMKGQGFRAWLTVYEQVCGAPAKAAVLDALPVELSNAIRFGGIVSSGWYAIEWYEALYEAHGRVGPRIPGFARKMGRLTTEHDLRGVYSFIVRMLSPATVFTNSARVAKLYIQQVDVTVLKNSDASAEVRLVVPGATQSIWDELVGGTEAILEANRAVDPRCDMTVTEPGVAILSAQWKNR
jgi:hypothetical protein